ncbi:MAG: hypothetical protein L0Z53_23195, partial [Acidobacteriales bacterium]|nr:hypothetical protein [Terriglobales bacterium]
SMYVKYGRETGLLYYPDEIAQMQAAAKLFRSKYGAHEVNRNVLTGAERDSKEWKDSAHANAKLFWSLSYRSTANYDGQMRTAEVERLPDTVYVRKLLFNAEHQRRLEDPERALSLYEEAWPIWVDIAVSYPEFAKISTVQEDIYELMLNNLRLTQKQRTDVFKKLAMGMAQWGNWPYPPWEEILDSSAKIKIIPIRKVRGILDQVYYYDGPEAAALKSFLLQWTQGAAGPIRMIYPGQLGKTLSASVWGGQQPSPPWVSVADPSSVMSVRERMGLFRTVLPIEGPQVPIAVPSKN